MSDYFDKVEVKGVTRPIQDTEGRSLIQANADAIEELQAGKQDKLSFDTTPTANSTNPVTSGGVYDAIKASNAGIVEAINTNEFTVELPTFYSGNVYDITLCVQEWNSNIGAVAEYIASISGTSRRLSLISSSPSYITASISDNKVNFRYTLTGHTAAYWRARFVKMSLTS